jgi:hypothetical protein
MSLLTFIDESSMPRGAGHVYVFGMVMVSPPRIEECEDRLLAAVNRKDRIHYAESSLSRRSQLVELVADLPVLAVSIGSDGPIRSEERTRRRLLARIFGPGMGLPDGVSAVFLESRGNALDLRDKSLIQQVARHSEFKVHKVRHIGWRGQPMLWAADVVAGSVTRALAKSEDSPFPLTWM